MSGPSKYTPPPPFPMRMPYPFPLGNSDRPMNVQPNIPRNVNPGQYNPLTNQTPPFLANNAGFPYLPNRNFNPFLNGYGGFQGSPYIPYSPFARPVNQLNMQQN